MNNKRIVGIILFIILIGLIIGIKVFSSGGSVFSGPTTTVYVATGGGKEDFLKDPEVNKILKEKYGLEVVYDNWSNGDTVRKALIRENSLDKAGDKDIVNAIANGDTMYEESYNNVLELMKKKEYNEIREEIEKMFSEEDEDEED